MVALLGCTCIFLAGIGGDGGNLEPPSRGAMTLDKTVARMVYSDSFGALCFFSQ